jgi:hypothetical protein
MFVKNSNGDSVTFYAECEAFVINLGLRCNLKTHIFVSVILDGIIWHSPRTTPNYAGLARALALAGYAVYGMDYPGFGMSEGLHGYIPNFSNLVDDVIEQYQMIKGDLPLCFGHVFKIPIFVYWIHHEFSLSTLLKLMCGK